MKGTKGKSWTLDDMRESDCLAIKQHMREAAVVYRAMPNLFDRLVEQINREKDFRRRIRQLYLKLTAVG